MDGGLSLGEAKTANYSVSEFYQENPSRNTELVIENCASGGHREPSMIEISSMSSFSDAHECIEIP